MSLIILQCPNCGANSRADDKSDKFVCDYCGTEYALRDTVNNYSVSQNYSTVQYITKNITGAAPADSEEYIKKGDVFVSLERYERAAKAYCKAIELNPADWRGWFGIVKICTRNFTDYKDELHFDYYETAKKVAAGEQLSEIERLYEPYFNKRRELEAASVQKKKANLRPEATEPTKTGKLFKIALLAGFALSALLTVVLMIANH